MCPCHKTRGTVACLIVVLLGLLPIVGHAQPTAPRVRSSADRTAIWVGDRVTFTIEIACPKGFDVLDDDLSRGALKLDGLDVVSADSSVVQRSGGDGTTRTFRYVLTSRRVDLTSLAIASMRVRYYATRQGQRLEDTAAAGEVQVPGAVIALRSTLPDAQEIHALRDGRPARVRAGVFRAAGPVGLGLVVLSIVPAAIWVIAFVGRHRGRRTTRSVGQVRQQARTSLEAVRTMEMETADGRREAYTRIDALIRGHLLEVCGIAGPNLTPAEIAPALAAHARRPARGRAVPAEAVAALLVTCERARYGPPDTLPSAEACREALAQAEQVLAAR